MEKTPSVIHLEQVQKLFLQKSGIDITKFQNRVNNIDPETVEKEIQILKKFLTEKQIQDIKNGISIRNKKRSFYLQNMRQLDHILLL